MKRSKEYLKELFEEPFDLEDENSIDYDFLQVIRMAQEDAIRDTVQECARNAYCDLIHPPDEDYPELEESEYMVVKSSIFSVADKLIKEL